MVKLALYFKAELENITDVGPGGEDYEWHFKVKCTSCYEVNENWTKNDVPGSRGTANFNSDQFSPIVIIECRGLEFVDFDPRFGFSAKGVDSETIFENIDLTEGYWADYDEKNIFFIKGWSSRGDFRFKI
ncbi:4082_t:CDS:2 [Diversispora eburnea]|uniref:4082_t:CDS:1 n=1 Tax=Diversispora eburnea TaxID=1213867 RepID=A0A9N9A8S8_9GLOM|nr:4082_t:CDS:2 [Diversispora eburnea]